MIRDFFNRQSRQVIPEKLQTLAALRRESFSHDYLPFHFAHRSLATNVR